MDYITDKEACLYAALDVKMELTSVQISQSYYSGSTRPPHCFLDPQSWIEVVTPPFVLGAQMILNTNGASTGSCSTTYKCICEAQTS